MQSALFLTGPVPALSQSSCFSRLSRHRSRISVGPFPPLSLFPHPLSVSLSKAMPQARFPILLHSPGTLPPPKGGRHHPQLDLYFPPFSLLRTLTLLGGGRLLFFPLFSSAACRRLPFFFKTDCHAHKPPPCLQHPDLLSKGDGRLIAFQ